MNTLPAPRLSHVCDLSVTVGLPLDAGICQGLGSQGQRRIVPITGGTVSGLIQGEVLAGGADFQLIPNASTALLDARYLLKLADGSHIFVQNRAIRRAAPEVTAALMRGDTVDASAVYFACTPTFEVSHPSLQWLTESIFVGIGQRMPTEVLLSIYRIDG